MKQIPGISTIYDQYDGFLIDSWGVLQDGAHRFPAAVECLETLMTKGKKIIIVSNAARRHNEIRRELEKVGITDDLYTDVMSSGEMAWLALQARAIETINGPCGYYLGPARSRSLCDGLDYQWTDSLEEANFVLNTGAPNGNPDNANHLTPMLMKMRDLNLPMICANPDQIAIRGGELGISAGAIAKLYQKLEGGPITTFGKPGTDIFHSALSLLPTIEKSKIIMIGDGLATDIAGAQYFGIDSVFIAGGIHGGELNMLDKNSITQGTREYGVSPTFVCETFSW
jgi:HAD superfamily hydrolase (TIGR01459 family)